MNYLLELRYNNNKSNTQVEGQHIEQQPQKMAKVQLEVQLGLEELEAEAEERPNLRIIYLKKIRYDNKI